MKNLLLSFSNFDYHFARFICKLCKTDNQNLFLSAALTTQALRDGHVCCNLEEHARQQFQTTVGPITLPDSSQLIEEIRSFPVIGAPGQYCPLILENSRLYLYRYWNYEQKLAQSILSRTGQKNEIVYDENAALIRSLSQPSTDNETDWQTASAIVSLLNPFTVICGGPGTGKTTTAAKVLLLLKMCLKKNLRIALAAPTGKAAARLSDSIQKVLASLDVSDELKKAIPSQTHTIHRLLGTIPLSPGFRHNSSSPLPYDIILVDEASMIDLALMSKLIDAVPQKSRLIMLGDRDQLSSVEAGAVIGDICDTGNTHQFTVKQSEILKQLLPGFNEPGNPHEPPLADCIVSLRKSYRFDESSGIGTLSRAVNRGDINEVSEILDSSKYDDCIRKPLPSEHNLKNALKTSVMEFFRPLCTEKDPLTALNQLGRFKILCAARQGPYGVNSINSMVISILRSSGLIPRETDLFHGLPLLINANDYALDLYNGDSGVIIPEQKSSGVYRAVFKNPETTVKSFQVAQLRSWEIAYALTVHKSQGSEYEHIILILPPVPIPVLSRELVYTALTRARKSVEIWSSDSILEKAVLSRTVRRSGLRDKLWGFQ